MEFNIYEAEDWWVINEWHKSLLIDMSYAGYAADR